MPEVSPSIALIRQWAETRADDAGLLARLLLVAQRDRDTYRIAWTRGDEHLATLRAELAEAQREREQAFQALAVEGVSKERARSVANGIGVLAQRFNKFEHAARAELAEARKQEREWIPVSERMPEDERMVLTYRPDCPECGYGSAQLDIACISPHSLVGVQPVTHWMPLPPAPLPDTGQP